MQDVLNAAGDLVALLPPARIYAIADRIRGASQSDRMTELHSLVTSPAARDSLDRLLLVWRRSEMTGYELAGILMGAACTRRTLETQSGVELVWTGPTTPMVATRRTHQVLLDMIRLAEREIFMVSFVAYDVAELVTELNDAAVRNVSIKALLETSKDHGGSLEIDPISTLKASVPAAHTFAWTHRQDGHEDGRVHAKIVVVDRRTAFLTSANLTGHAFEKNMEAGVLIKDGPLPSRLHDHLQALIDTRVITLRS